MPFLKNSTFYSIKEAVYYSTGNRGLIAVYIDKENNKTFFINGKPSMKFKK